MSAWYKGVMAHIDYQEQAYGDAGVGAVCMRKHMLWYLKGWPGAKRIREKVVAADSCSGAKQIIQAYYDQLCEGEVLNRIQEDQNLDSRFVWDPKFEMDRKLDRGVGHEGLS